MLIDTHAHLNFAAFNTDFDKVIEDCFSQDIWMINVGAKYDTSKKAVKIAESYENGVYASLGLHPIHAKDEDFKTDDYKELAKSKKVVAIGETGLDYFKHYGSFAKKQKQLFLEHLNMSKELGLPIILHCRMAHNDLIDLLNFTGSVSAGVVHCFTGDWKLAKKYLDRGLYIGINGIMYKFDLKEVIEKTPLDRLLLETDSPYLGKERRNTPLFVRQIAKDIARIKNVSFEQVAQTTTQNAQNLFNI